MHHVDRATPWDEIWQAMEQLVREGKVTYVGSSNFAAWDIALAQSAATTRHFLGLTSEQCLYNLAKRSVEMELIPALRHLGVGLIAYSPLHAGLLAGALEAIEIGTASTDLKERAQPIRGQLHAFETLCREIGAEPAHVALAWLLHDPVVSPRSSAPDRLSSCKPISAPWRYDSSRTSRSYSTGSGPVPEKHHRHTPGDSPRKRLCAVRAYRDQVGSLFWTCITSLRGGGGQPGTSSVPVDSGNNAARAQFPSENGRSVVE
jgi:hypothetical protein